MTLSKDEQALLPPPELGRDAAAHVILFLNGWVILVDNKPGTTKNGFPKPGGLGLPGGAVHSDENAIQAAKREAFEETGGVIAKEMIKIFPKPLLHISSSSANPGEKGGGRIDFFFVGEISGEISLPYKTKVPARDPDDKVTGFILLDPFKDIKEVYEGTSMRFLVASTGELVYKRHMNAIQRALEADFEALKNHIDINPKDEAADTAE